MFNRIKFPILLLLSTNLLVGMFTFRSYGLSWDEPLFYDYARALPYAYSPAEWFGEDFDLEKAFGSSGSDHANRGPAYLLLAQPAVNLLEQSGIDTSSAWHLVNFITFQFGVFLFYLLAKRWMDGDSALFSTALFSWQPLLWGHAFINPKDPPFMVFFIGAVYFGFELVDNIQNSSKPVWRSLLLAVFFMGIATSIRVLGPLAGLLTLIYAFGKINKTNLIPFIYHFTLYAGLSIIICFATWPYLWTDPIQKFIEVFGFMSANPTSLPVLFAGSIFPADELPRRYFPVLLSITLTEPVYPLIVMGFFTLFLKEKKLFSFNAAAMLFWFMIPFLYVTIQRPTMYDGYRHFLFCLPPLFIVAGVGWGYLQNFSSRKVVRALIAALVLLPGIFSAVQLHPYEYTYYNSIVGGTNGAFRRFETDYWLTCYKESVESFEKTDSMLFVKRESYIAEQYEHDGIQIRDLRSEAAEMKPGDYVLINTRTNEDLKVLKDAPIVQVIKRGTAEFCIIKQLH